MDFLIIGSLLVVLVFGLFYRNGEFVIVASRITAAGGAVVALAVIWLQRVLQRRLNQGAGIAAAEDSQATQIDSSLRVVGQHARQMTWKPGSLGHSLLDIIEEQRQHAIALENRAVQAERRALTAQTGLDRAEVELARLSAEVRRMHVERLMLIQATLRPSRAIGRNPKLTDN